MTQNVNLLTALSIKPISAFNTVLVMQISVVWVLLLVLVYTVASGVLSNRQQNLIAFATTQKTLLAKIDAYNKELTKFHGETHIDTKNLPVSSGNLIGFYRYFEDLAKFIPHGVWLNYLSFSETDNSITITGSTIAASGVSALLEALDKSPSFNNKKFNTLQLEKKPESNNTDFTISTLNPHAPTTTTAITAAKKG